MAPDRFETIVNAGIGARPKRSGSGCCARSRVAVRYAGYWDADLATPLSEIPRFIAYARCTSANATSASGRVYSCSAEPYIGGAYRHYIGRLFATAASAAVRLPVYDTQCGAKLFRVSPAMRALFEEPFLGRWTFDVEIIARLTQQCAGEQRRPRDLMYELPLDEWRDIDGSKVHPLDFFAALIELGRIRRRYGSNPLLTRRSGITVEHEHRVEIH